MLQSLIVNPFYKKIFRGWFPDKINSTIQVKLFHNIFGETRKMFYLCTHQIKDRAPVFGTDTHF